MREHPPKKAEYFCVKNNWTIHTLKKIQLLSQLIRHIII